MKSREVLNENSRSDRMGGYSFDRIRSILGVRENQKRSAWDQLREDIENRYGRNKMEAME